MGLAGGSVGFGASIFGVGGAILGVGAAIFGAGCAILGGGSAILGFITRSPLFDFASPPLFDFNGSQVREIFVSSSSRTVSWIMAPQVRQMERVGARSRLQTGHIIGVLELGWICFQRDKGKTQKEYQRLL